MSEDTIVQDSTFIYKRLDVKNKIKEIAILLVLAMFIGIFWIVFLLFVGGGVTIAEFYQKYSFYSAIVIAGTIILAFLSILSIITKGKVDSLIHDPEQSLLSGFKFLYNPWYVIFGGLAFGCILGLMSSLKNTFFVGVPQSILPQIAIQQMEFLKIFFAAEPAAIGETLMFAVFFSLYNTGLNYFFTRKGKGVSKTMYALLLLPAAIAFGLLWMLYHQIAYPGQEAALLNVFIFGFLGAGISLAMNSFLIWWTIHSTANAFIQLNTLYSNDIIAIWTIVLVLLLTLLMTLTYMITKKLKGNKHEV